MTHLIFAKDGTVAVELFSAQLVAERSFDKLWFFAHFTERYGTVVLRPGPLRSRRSVVGNDEAERTVRCVAEVSVGGRAPACGSAPRRGVHFGVIHTYTYIHWHFCRERGAIGPKLAANNYAASLGCLRRGEEAKSLLRKTIPVARRVLGENNEITLRLKLTYAMTLYRDPAATLDDLREAVTTLEETARTARRVLGGAHPLTTAIERALQNARAALRARETGDA